MPYIVDRRYDGNGDPRWYSVELQRGTSDRPQFSARVDSYVDALALRNMLNSIHPDLMDHAFRTAISEASDAMRSAAE